VFFSTHILSDVKRVCDTVAILHEGRVVTQATMADLKSRYGGTRLLLEVSSGAEALAAELGAAPWAVEVHRIENGTLSVAVRDLDAARREIPAAVAARNLGLVRFEAGEVSLEEVFVDLVGGEAR
jgi:ABC-2 type transport system ATP-binding protein